MNPKVATQSTDTAEFEEDAIRVLSVLLRGRIFHKGGRGYCVSPTVVTQSADIVEFREDAI